MTMSARADVRDYELINLNPSSPVVGVRRVDNSNSNDPWHKIDNAYVAPRGALKMTVNGGNYCTADYKVLFADGRVVNAGSSSGLADTK